MEFSFDRAPVTAANPRPGDPVAKGEVFARLGKQRLVLEHANSAFGATAEFAKRCTEQEEEARIAHRAELRQRKVDRDAALVEAKGSRNQVAKSAEEFEDLKSEVNLAT